MQIEDRLAKLIRAARNGRLEVKFMVGGKYYNVSYADLLYTKLRDLLIDLEDDKFTYDGEVI